MWTTFAVVRPPLSRQRPEAAAWAAGVTLHAQLTPRESSRPHLRGGAAPFEYSREGNPCARARALVLAAPRAHRREGVESAERPRSVRSAAASEWRLALVRASRGVCAAASCRAGPTALTFLSLVPAGCGSPGAVAGSCPGRCVRECRSKRPTSRLLLACPCHLLSIGRCLTPVGWECWRST